ncbi:dihydrofolate reductase family protein [Paenibacillus sp. GCM10012307]|uniref:Dihydrofolate reductase n=1 Tax=Paenibacillus roseus TaxID=2798579 RepID=A0A934IYD2_9BACL|nr:dihydrofolate reductase family protein [Paenibacillus roseus]MBJ6361516.1 dihydrofolate reductase [Paenibacillus roseus]
MKTNQVILYIATSLDGYIARADGSVDWLDDIEGDGGDSGYGAFYSGIDTLVMGRLTYEEVLKLSDEFPYKGKPTYVLTKSELPADPNVVFTDEAVETLIPRLKEMSNGPIWLVGGGQLVQAFLDKGFIDEMQIALIPKLLGAGIPLFPQGTAPGTFTLKQVSQSGQMVMLHYVK